MQVLMTSCGQMFHSEREDRNNYGENLYMCWGSSACYTDERAMDRLCECFQSFQPHCSPPSDNKNRNLFGRPDVRGVPPSVSETRFFTSVLSLCVLCHR